MRIHFAVAAWGDTHVGLLEEVLIPALLAPRNLPALGDPQRCEFTVYTRRADIDRIEAALAPIRSMMPAWCAVIDTEVPADGNRHASCSAAHEMAIRRAYEWGAALVALPPDLVVSNNLIDTLERCAAHGAHVVHAIGVRLNVEIVGQFLAPIRRRADGILDIQPRTLVELGMQYLHPINDFHRWQGGGPHLEPSMMLWRARGGLLARCFHLHPLFIRPQVMPARFTGTVDADFALLTVPDFGQHVVLTDSDAGCMFGLDNLDKTYPAPVAKGDVDGVRQWASGQNTNALHRWLIGHEIRLHGDDARSDDWAAASDETERVVAAILGGLPA